MLKETNWAVMVVPILAPMMVPTAWVKVISPELTKPTIITVVVELDCRRAVTAAPVKTAFKGWDVNISKIRLMRSPAALCSPSPKS